MTEEKGYMLDAAIYHGFTIIDPTTFQCSDDQIVALLTPEKKTTECLLAVIEYAQTLGLEAAVFLDMWIHGDFPEIRESFDDVPEAVFYQG